MFLFFLLLFAIQSLFQKNRGHFSVLLFYAASYCLTSVSSTAGLPVCSFRIFVGKLFIFFYYLGQIEAESYYRF